MRPRDSQRSKVISATHALPPGKHIRTVPEIKGYVEKSITSRWFRNRWPWLKEIKIKDGRGRCNAGAGWNWHDNHFITLPRWARYERYLLHEIAHVVTPRRHAAHGPKFMKNFIALLEWKMKINPRPVFREYRVKWHPKRS